MDSEHLIHKTKFTISPRFNILCALLEIYFHCSTTNLISRHPLNLCTNLFTFRTFFLIINIFSPYLSLPLKIALLTVYLLFFFNTFITCLHAPAFFSGIPSPVVHVSSSTIVAVVVVAGEAPASQ